MSILSTWSTSFDQYQIKIKQYIQEKKINKYKTTTTIYTHMNKVLSAKKATL